VGAENVVSSCDLGILADQAAEPVRRVFVDADDVVALPSGRERAAVRGRD
jgi:hypothetical protein